LGQIVNKEYGSDFHLCLEEKWLLKKGNHFFNKKKTSFFLSGRSALFTLLKFGIKEHNWEKVFIPSYYCYEVNKYIEELPIEVIRYQFNPFTKNQNECIDIVDKSTNVIVNPDYFGVKKRTTKEYVNAFIIEDLTHNLLNIKNSKADYVFGSLRKELPLPVGGFLYSNIHNNIPKGKIKLEAKKIAFQKITAMYLKKQYLEGEISNKEEFREHYIASEDELGLKLEEAKLPRVAQAILEELDIEKILNQKANNLKYAFKYLKKYNNVSINCSIKNKGFGLIFKFKTKERRDTFRQYLIKESIFPAILWPSQKTDLDIDVENTIVFVHIDYRYIEKDIKYITDKINTFFKYEKL
jgi:hypothetical protein